MTETKDVMEHSRDHNVPGKDTTFDPIALLKQGLEGRSVCPDTAGKHLSPVDIEGLIGKSKQVGEKPIPNNAHKSSNDGQAKEGTVMLGGMLATYSISPPNHEKPMTKAEILKLVAKAVPMVVENHGRYGR